MDSPFFLQLTRGRNMGNAVTLGEKWDYLLEPGRINTSQQLLLLKEIIDVLQEDEEKFQEAVYTHGPEHYVTTLVEILKDKNRYQKKLDALRSQYGNCRSDEEILELLEGVESMDLSSTWYSSHRGGGAGRH